MKRIIKGKVYDTEKARKVGEFYYKHRGDLDYFWEFLYQKKTGEYFLHGEGGPMTHYAESLGSNNWGASDKIIPMDYDEAKDWAEEYMPTEEFEKEFGSPIEDESRTKMMIILSASAADKVRKEASKQGVSISGYIENLIG